MEWKLFTPDCLVTTWRVSVRLHSGTGVPQQRRAGAGPAPLDEIATKRQMLSFRVSQKVVVAGDRAAAERNSPM